jgi:hypothetical protein
MRPRLTSSPSPTMHRLSAASVYHGQTDHAVCFANTAPRTTRDMLRTEFPSVYLRPKEKIVAAPHGI